MTQPKAGRHLLFAGFVALLPQPTSAAGSCEKDWNHQPVYEAASLCVLSGGSYFTAPMLAQPLTLAQSKAKCERTLAAFALLA